MAAVRATPQLLDDTETARHLRDALLLEWVLEIPEDIETPGQKSMHAKRRLVDRVCVFIMDRRDDPPSLLEVCRAVGTSPRKLEYCFRDVLGISPSRYLRTLRLNAVRRELKRHRDDRLTVQDIAARWGFWHLSAFSADFKRHFGLSPGEFRRAGTGRAELD